MQTGKQESLGATTKRRGHALGGERAGGRRHDARVVEEDADAVCVRMYNVYTDTGKWIRVRVYIYDGNGNGRVVEV